MGTHLIHKEIWDRVGGFSENFTQGLVQIQI